MRQVTIDPGEDGFREADCPSLSGCGSQSERRLATLTDLCEAIEGYVFTSREDGLSVSGDRFEAFLLAV